MPKAIELNELRGVVCTHLKEAPATAIEGLTREHETLLLKRLQGRTAFTRAFNKVFGRTRIASFADDGIGKLLSQRGAKLVVIKDFKIESDADLANLNVLVEKRKGKTKLLFLQKPGAEIKSGKKPIDAWISVINGRFAGSYSKSLSDRLKLPLGRNLKFD